MHTVSKNAPTLHELQREMAALILSGTTSQHSDGSTFIAVPPRGTVAERLHVYAGGYPARINEALNESFPAVAHVLGEGAFRALVHRFIAAEAFHSYNLNDAGAALPGFLQTDRLSRDLPFLPDLARLEWRVARTFHARALPPFDSAVAADWTFDDWAHALVRFQASVALLESNWPIREIWECRETPIEEIDLDVRNRTDHVLVRWSGYAVVCESLDEAEARTLRALLAGQTLGAVIAARSECGHAPATVSGWFDRWMSLGLITECAVLSDD